MKSTGTLPRLSFGQLSSIGEGKVFVEGRANMPRLLIYGIVTEHISSLKHLAVLLISIVMWPLLYCFTFDKYWVWAVQLIIHDNTR